MKMKPLKLQHDYHDGRIRGVEYRGSDDISLEVDLCGCGNSEAQRVHLTFTGVRNFSEVKAALEGAREIVGIVRHEERGYLLDLGETPTGIRIDAKGLHET